MKRVPPEVEHDILRLSLVERFPKGTVSKQLAVHHSVVTRVLGQNGAVSLDAVVTRKRMVDDLMPWLRQALDDYPDICASRLFHMARDRGYEGASESHFRRIVASVRPRRIPEPFLRLDMPAGEQTQMDWGHFGTLDVGHCKRPLYAFVMTLSWSRMSFLKFFFDMKQASFSRGHVDAFEFFGGIARQVLYDNLKSACIERDGKAIRFNESLLEMASHYGFSPRLANPRRGNEKGRVERSIGYVRTNFFAARSFKDIDDLNRQALAWATEVAPSRRFPDDDRFTVRQKFEEERKRLLKLPDTPYEPIERTQARVGRTPYIRFDRNDYSLPCIHTSRTVEVLSEPHRIRIAVDGKVVATHARSYDRHATIEDPAHIEDIKTAKPGAQKSAGMRRLTSSAPATAHMIAHAAERGLNIGSLVSNLLGFLDTYGAAALDRAVSDVNEAGRLRICDVRLRLDAHIRETGRTPPRPVNVTNPKARDITVSPPDLSRYDQIGDDRNDHDEKDDK